MSRTRLPDPTFIEEPAVIGGVATRVVRIDGDADKPIFVFLHGFTDSADTWRRVQRRLGKAGYGSIAVDQPSHGVADPLDADGSALEQFVAFAAATAESVRSHGKVIVCGNSLGGAHTLLVAQRHPDLVDGAVVISPAALDHPRWFSALGRDQVRSGVEQRQPGEQRPNRARRALVSGAFRTVAFARPWRAPDGFVNQWRNNLRDPERRLAIRNLGMRLPEEYLNADPFDLTQIKAPLLALWGNQDRLTSITSRSTLEAEIADLEFIELRGIGHMPQIETPGLTTKYLQRFADRIATT